MLSLINILIIFFIFLIGYQLILASQTIIEGVENYKEYTDPSISTNDLSIQNAENISYLKQRVDKVEQTNKQENDLKKRVDVLEKQMEEVMVSTKEMGENLPGVGKPLETPTE
jgi:hypothetical protein